MHILAVHDRKIAFFNVKTALCLIGTVFLKFIYMHTASILRSIIVTILLATVVYALHHSSDNLLR